MQTLNLALEEAQRPERFFLLYTGDQICIVTFAPAKAFWEVAEALHIPLQHNPQSAMDRGVAYEQHVVQVMHQEQQETEFIDRAHQNKAAGGNSWVEVRWLK